MDRFYIPEPRPEGTQLTKHAICSFGVNCNNLTLVFFYFSQWKTKMTKLSSVKKEEEKEQSCEPREPRSNHQRAATRHSARLVDDLDRPFLGSDDGAGAQRSPTEHVLRVAAPVERAG